MRAGHTTRESTFWVHSPTANYPLSEPPHWYTVVFVNLVIRIAQMPLV